MIKWDGHTHSQFCRHGDGEATGLMIERAINLGFNKYSITEHAPLPNEVMSDPEMRADFGLTPDEMDDFFSHIDELKRIYGNRIEILAGLEIDYLEGYDEYTEDLLLKYQQRMDDVIFSVHFVLGEPSLLPVDYSTETFESLVECFGSVDQVYLVYWDTIKKLVEREFNGLNHKRIGHIALINKFSKKFTPSSPKFRDKLFYEALFIAIKKHHWIVDFDVAGLDYEFCRETYLPEYLQYWCDKLNVEVVYGSDAHCVNAVGKYYEHFERFRASN